MLIEAVYGIASTALSMDERFTLLSKKGIPAPGKLPERLALQNFLINMSRLSAHHRRIIQQMALRLQQRTKHEIAKKRFIQQQKMRRYDSRQGQEFLNSSVTGRQEQMASGLFTNTEAAGRTRSQTARRSRPWRRGGPSPQTSRGTFQRYGQQTETFANIVQQRGRRGLQRGMSARGRTMRARGRGGIAGTEQRHDVTKEQLDAELDAYMSMSRSALDRDLDEYMMSALD